MLNITMLSRVEARALPGCRRESLYGTDWENCEGSEGLPEDAAAEMLADWTMDDTITHGMPVTEYRYVPGVELADAVYFECERLLGRVATVAEVVQHVNETWEVIIH